MDNDENWAKSENPEVEAAKDAYADGVQAAKLREQITNAAANAVNYGNVDRDWINENLARLGANPVTGTSEYRMNIQITGLYGWRCKASSRAEAVARFKEQVTRIAEAGKITADGSYDNVYGVAFHGAPVFYSGPEEADYVESAELDLAGLKEGIRAMLKRAVAEKGWSHGRARETLALMGLEALPERHNRPVTVPVGGTISLAINVFDDATDDEIQAAVAATIVRMKHVYVAADEVGKAQYASRTVSEDDGEEDPF